MRADGINPRVGLVVALCSIFLIFGFMFTISGTRGETLGRVPLIVLGPAVFLPGIAIITLANRTEGFSSWPWRRTSRDRRRSPQGGGWVLEGVSRCRRDSCSRNGSSWSRHVSDRQVEKQEVCLWTCDLCSGLTAALGTCVFDPLCTKKNPTYTRSHFTSFPIDGLTGCLDTQSGPCGSHGYYSNGVRWADETVV